MRIVYHLGVHCTDEERLLRCLLKNRGALAREGIAVPGPTRYRNLLRDTAMELKGRAASMETQALVLDQVMEEDEADRLILSWDNFLAFSPWAVNRRLYPQAAERILGFTRVFPQIEAEFHFAIRNIATYLPLLLRRQKDKTYDQFMNGTNPLDLSWAEVVEDIVARNPGVPLTVWCDEDTPLIWPEVLQAVSGHSEGLVLEDTDELHRTLMPAEGVARLAEYLAANPPATVSQRRRIVSAFLDKFALPEKVDLEVDLPGWTPALVADLAALYRQDIARIKGLPGVRFLTA